MIRRTGAVLTASLALAVLAACSGSDEPEGGVLPSGTVSKTPSPMVATPGVQEAVDAYARFTGALIEAEQDPVEDEADLSPAADFTKFSYDPALSQTIVDMQVLVEYNSEMRGPPPESNVKVKAVDLEADPYPSVQIEDCLVPQGEYVPYNRETDKKLELTNTGDPMEPYLLTAEIISVRGRWGVSTLEIQQEGTCQP